MSAAFLLVLLAPRIIRMLWPQVWIEDDSYLNGAFLLASGRAPYTTFPLPHFPLLEGMLAALFQVLPASIRTAEAFSQTAMFASSVLVWRLGRRLSGNAGGMAAAIVFATSPLLFRYHVFEREVFLIVPVLAACWLALGPAAPDARAESRRGAAEGLLLAAAMAIKLTAMSDVAAMLLFLLFVVRRRREAVVMLATAVALMAVATIICLALFGMPFLVQVVLFRLVHGGFHTLSGQWREWLGSLDLAFAAGAAGLTLLLVTRDARRWHAWALPLLNLGFGILLLVVLNPTFWAHDSVELLPWFALLAGVLVQGVAAARRASSRHSRGAVVAALAGAAVLLMFVTPLRHANWGPGAASAYGFGYRDRAEIDRAASFVRTHTSPGEPVAMPPILAFQANRPELVVYPELAGTIMTLEREVKEKGILNALRTTEVGQAMFWDEVNASREVWLPTLATAITHRQVGAVINFSPADLFPVPLIDVPDAPLRASGYSPALVTEHYVVWIAEN